jgi:4-diphosphocytidyl-2-C-methyl-D-erythritol kinase
MSQAKHSAHNKTHFVQSYAKINLTLDVLKKRADGYHELITIMQTIDLYDTICLSSTDEDRVSIICNQAALSSDDNLAVRAAQAIRHKLGLTQGLLIELNKRVPVAAGLGGGSSNAAAILLALQQWWQLPLSMDDLWEIASALGSDVPFFLSGGLARCEGRGERITPLSPHWPTSMRWLLLLKPAISVSTANVFRNLSASDYTDGSWSHTVETALQTSSHLQPSNLYNSLERGVLTQYAEVAQAREDLFQAGATNVRLSGSGPTLFSLFDNLSDAAQVQSRLQEQGHEVYLTQAINTSGMPINFFA